MPIENKQDLARHIQLKKTTEEARMHTAALMNLFNVMGKDQRDAAVAGMLDAMTREHRYIQQEFMSALQTTLGQYSKTGTDARNQAGVAWAGIAAALQIDPSFY